ncbi:MAG: amidohydrolase family protein, partial [Alphaproteobacteria bacterium]|nr:amidohydrolase family protein [Alphaproteobacteria bacterium]
PGEATLAAVRAALADWSFDRANIRPAVAPTIPHHCSDDFIRGCANIARDFDVGLHSHVAESKVQALAGIKLYGKTLTAHLDELGALGPQFTVAHGVWLDDDDMKRLGDRGASIAHNPGSNMRLGAGLADARAMLDAQVNLGIGTDGANCSDNQNMYEAMRLASFVSKVQGPEWRRWMTTTEVERAPRRRAAPARSASAIASAASRAAIRPISSCSISTIRTGCRSTTRSTSSCTARTATPSTAS